MVNVVCKFLVYIRTKSSVGGLDKICIGIYHCVQKEVNMANKDLEKERAYQKAYREAHKEKIRSYKKVYRETHKEKINAWCESHKEELRAYRKAYNASHKNEYKANYKVNRLKINARKLAYFKTDTNSLGIPKGNIRGYSSQYLFKTLKHPKLKGYEIHHCFGYEDYKCFIYIPKELHLQIHQYLRDNGISADSNHFSQIVHLINGWNGYTYIKV